MTERQPTVLVVAADELTRRRYVDWLDGADHRVVGTGVRDEALAMAKRAAVVLVDGPLGGTSHATMVRALDRQGRAGAVVSVGSAGSPGLDCDAVLESPVAPEDLARVVDRLVSRATYVDRLDALLAAARRATGTTAEPGSRTAELQSETRSLQREFEAGDFEAMFRAIGPS
ncbi:hypothetical protein [Haloarchaeobius sp. TZWWS8]|uniref:hypothetical protein n=1 Tax=Haloarchaeobius sp. TZWWS8 TaxID=3446121 RepID=UPI003EB998A1